MRKNGLLGTIIPLALGFFLGCSDDSTPGTDDVGSDSGTETDCTIGAQGCPCTAGGACDPGLTCELDTCVPDGSETGTAEGTDTTTTDTTTDTTTTDTDTTTTDTTDTTTDTGDPPPNCGDAVVDHGDGEQCDDGNLVDGDGCSSFCQVEVGPACGDGTLEPGNGEECDDGNGNDGDGCSANCQFEPLGQSCGDNSVDGNEVCDDGNLGNGDGCNPTCNLGNTTSLFVGAPGQAGLVDGMGMAARIGGFGGLAVDNTYLWLGDGANNVIRRIDIATATVVTVVGDAANGNPGDIDDANGLAARISGPTALATDGTTLWFGDGANRKLKAVDLTPPYAVTTVAGSGAQGVADGVGNQATFNDLRGVTYYAGMVYMVDANGVVLRRFDPQTQQVTTLAGSPNNPGVADGVGNQAQFISPRYMSSDNSGMLFIADTNGYHIRTYNVASNTVGTFAGTGMAGYVDGIGQNAAIHRPRGMTSDGTSIYWTEFNQHTVRQGVIATQSVTTLVGQHCNGGAPCNGNYSEGVGTQARLNGPFALAFHYPSNSIFLLDAGNNVIRRIQ